MTGQVYPPFTYEQVARIAEYQRAATAPVGVGRASGIRAWVMRIWGAAGWETIRPVATLYGGNRPEANRDRAGAAVRPACRP